MISTRSITPKREEYMKGRVDRQAAKVELELERLFAIVPSSNRDRLSWLRDSVDRVRLELRAEVSAAAANYRSRS